MGLKYKLISLEISNKYTEKIIKLLEKIETTTREINKNFIFDFLFGNKAELSKDDFFEKSLLKISDDYKWDERKILSSNLKEILNNPEYNLKIFYNELITNLAETIPAGYMDELGKLLSLNQIPVALINKFTIKSVSLVYPYFDNIFFIETQDQYIFFSLGYID